MLPIIAAPHSTHASLMCKHSLDMSPSNDLTLINKQYIVIKGIFKFFGIEKSADFLASYKNDD